MKIKDLITILKTAPDIDGNIYIPSIQSDRTTNIECNFDDIGDIDMYEVVK